VKAMTAARCLSIGEAISLVRNDKPIVPMEAKPEEFERIHPQLMNASFRLRRDEFG